MKSGIHPSWHPEAQVICACGMVFTVGSTKPKIHIEVCSRCHPSFTGESRFVDTLGRVERFQQKQKQATKSLKKIEAVKEDRRPKTLKEMLMEIKKQ